MDNVFPFLVADAIRAAGCHQSVAEKIQLALEELPPDDSLVLWLRLQGRSYGDIGETLNMNKGQAWNIIHHRIKRSVYSIIEHSTAIPVTAMVS